LSQQVQSAAGAGFVRTMITNEGNHTPEDWAKMTASQLVELDPEIDERRRTMALELRGRIARTLVEAFHAVTPSISAAELWRLTVAAHQRIETAAKGSPWEEHFAQPDIRRMMGETIFRNLNTAADLALRTE